MTWPRCCSGLQLKDGDAACGYYRSRPLLLALGVPLADALGSGMGLAGGYSDGRDIGVVFNYPNPGGAHALPMCGGVGAQYTPAAGWAQAIDYKTEVLKEGPPTRSRWCSAATRAAPPADFGRR